MLKRLLYLVLLSSGYLGYAQPNAPAFPAPASRLPPAPNAAALERYALMPVNEASGTPSVNIPLYEVRSGQLTLPISVSYHASGVRVADQASWVGLGWALEAGGVITKAVRGTADDDSLGIGFITGGLYNQVPQRSTIFNTVPLPDNFLRQISEGQLDYQPDLYTYNFQGHAGSFMFGNDGKFHPLPVKPIRINYQANGTFLLTDSQGVSYLFASRELTKVHGRQATAYTSAWYLNRIVSADKSDTIRLEYEPYSLTSTAVQQQHSIVSNIEPFSELESSVKDNFTESYSSSTLNSFRLRRIVFRGGQVLFSAPQNRLDAFGDRCLAAVTVLANQRDTLKHVRFYQSYFNGEYQGTSRDQWLRLRLDSIATTAPGVRLPAHTFTYNTIALPNRLVGARDHWGYFNNATETFSPLQTPMLIPTQPVYAFLTANSILTTYAGVNREPNPAYTQAGILRQITYPTGGRVNFVYESNTVARRYRIPNPRTTHSAQATGPGSEPGPSYVTRRTEFTLSDPMTEVRYEASAPPGSDRDNAEITLSDVTQPTQPTILLRMERGNWQRAGVLADLQAQHTYELKVTAYRSASASIRLSYESTVVNMAWRNEIVGGVRLREQRIQTAPTAPATIKRYTYTTPGTELSSGYLIGGSTPIYARHHMRRIRGKNPCPDCPYNAAVPKPVNILYTTLTSNSLTDVLGGGRIIGYPIVTVTDSSSTGEVSGRVVSHYSTARDGGGGWKPVCPPVSGAWLRDHLLWRGTYVTLPNGQQELIAATKNEYVQRDTLEIWGFSAATDASIEYDPSGAPYENMYPYAYENTRQSSGYQYLTRTRQYQYAKGDTTAYQLTTTSYRYDNLRHQQPTSVETTLSNGKRQVLRYRYAADYDTSFVSTGRAQAVRELLRNHQVATLLEQNTLLLTGTDTLITQGALALPRVLAPRRVVTDQQLTYQPASPQPLAHFLFSRLRNGELVYATGYEPEVFYEQYDAQANLLQQRTRGGQPVSYLWNQALKEPIAHVQAAQHAQVAFTSFEADSPGGWTYSPANRVSSAFTGSQGYGLGGSATVQRTGLPAGSYELSLWAHGTGIPQVSGASQQQRQEVAVAGDWHQHRYQLTLPANATVEVSTPGYIWIDEVRLHPMGAQMTTYTHQPLVGVSSVSDVNGQPTRYEYDGLGRLKLVRDLRGNIRQQQQYHYKPQ